MTNFIKVVYFDEGSVTDYLQIVNGGDMKKTEDMATTLVRQAGISGEGSAEVGTDTKGLPKPLRLLTGIKFAVGGKANAGVSKNEEHVIRNILENTILTDFLDSMNKNKTTTSIKFYRHIKMYPEANSFSFVMMAAPYLSIINGELPIDTSDETNVHVDISKISTAVEQGRGYYEFIGSYRRKDMIFRFNRKAFRNNYTLSDVPKMSLSVYAVKVGEAARTDLYLNTEFQFGTGEKDRFEYTKDFDCTEHKKLEVYDVLLAGITGKLWNEFLFILALTKSLRKRLATFKILFIYQKLSIFSLEERLKLQMSRGNLKTHCL